MSKYLICQEKPPVPPYDPAGLAQGLLAQLAQFLFPLLVELDKVLDKRLVRTFLQIIVVILTFRDRANGLLLSELGGYLLSPDKAPAGTKRLSNLLHSAKWSAWLITRFLWQRASDQLAEWQQVGQEGLVIWDESGWEKPESLQLDDLGPTRSSKAARLTHIKPGYYSPPRGPIFVPGLQWLAVLLIGRFAQQGPPLLAAQRWWSNRGLRASFKCDEEGKLLVDLAAAWGRSVIHVFDQGFASAFWLGVLLATLAYAFLLTLLQASYEWLRLWLLRYYCHRTGTQCRAAKLPLTRLRCALSRLWQDRPPNFAGLAAPLKPIHVTEVA